MVTLGMFLVGANGDTINLQGPDYILETGFNGVGLLTSTVRLQASAADGAVWRGSRREARVLDLPVSVLGSNRQDVEDKLRRLQRALSDRVAPPYLEGRLSNGDRYRLKVHYQTGAETTYGPDGNFYRARWVLSMVAPKPYWESTTPVQFSARQVNDPKGLLPELSKLQLTPSDVVGEVTLNNTGDVDAFPTFVVTGPATEVTISLEGEGFTYLDEIDEGDTLTVSNSDGTVVDGDGVNVYSGLGPAPKFFSVPPGVSSLTLQAVGAGVDTLIQGFFLPRREVIF
jgi:hypothetical protein